MPDRVLHSGNYIDVTPDLKQSTTVKKKSQVSTESIKSERESKKKRSKEVRLVLDPELAMILDIAVRRSRLTEAQFVRMALKFYLKQMLGEGFTQLK